MNGPWTAAVDEHIALIDRLERPGIARVFADAFALSVQKRDSQPCYAGAIAATDPDNDRYLVDTSRSFSDYQVERLRTAPTYWVSAEMLDVVDAAAESMRDEDFLATDVPTMSGFALLERSLGRTDRRGQHVTNRAIAWWPAHWGSAEVGVDGIEFVYYVDVDDPDDDINKTLDPETRHEGGRLQVQHVQFWAYGRSVESLTDEYVDDHPDRDHFLPADELRELGEKYMRWQQAFWRLMQQRIAHSTVVHPDRHTARRVARSGALTDFVGVHAITLRRYSEAQPAIDGAGHEPVAWSHRWLVDGHWRNQPYPSLGVHRQIWIAPYVKGPDDKPLKIDGKVYRWAR